MDLPWTEKYRPQTLDDMAGQKPITERLKAYVEQGSMPHLLFAGPAGVGKTTATMCIARSLFGDVKTDFLELNASDERGIDVVRNKIKDFARTRSISGDFKIIFLDEADNLTSDAQNALRRTMENYTRTCRFILSCNYSSKIIDPLQSRCAIFRFKKILPEEIKKFLLKILKAEGMQYDDAGIDAILYISEGDMRRSVNILQSAAALGKVDEETVYAVTTQARPDDVKELIRLSVQGQFMKARDMLDKLLLDYGLSGEDVLLQMNKEVWNTDVSDKMKISLIDLVGEANFTLVEGANERIQLEALIARLSLLTK